MIARAQFRLKDWNPSSEQFRKQFMAAYGVNASIEPAVEADDRELYEQVLPHLESDPRRAVGIVANALSTLPRNDKPAFRFLLGAHSGHIDGILNGPPTNSVVGADTIFQVPLNSPVRRGTGSAVARGSHPSI